eukprot:TRINITY_DN6466_c0_g1_i1.p1 TRINITY_DN6466_c0_g1~~TRINITY_DN6466_c0_g1_i1.p1  ORF type:complete len:449 (+),score=62.06 TRINITY_DN6466_c0_g1_i1:585-1931(+)
MSPLHWIALSVKKKWKYTTYGIAVIFVIFSMFWILLDSNKFDEFMPVISLAISLPVLLFYAIGFVVHTYSLKYERTRKDKIFVFLFVVLFLCMISLSIIQYFTIMSLHDPLENKFYYAYWLIYWFVQIISLTLSTRYFLIDIYISLYNLPMIGGSSNGPLIYDDVYQDDIVPSSPFEAPEINADNLTFGIDDEIALGSFGTVYKAMWYNNPVAVKKLRLPSNIKEVKNEIKMLSQYPHPRIVQFMGICDKNDRYTYLVFELCEAGDLRNFLVDIQLNDEEYNRILYDIAQAVEYLHENDIIHRDLKPGNILILHEEHKIRAKLCDFGTSRHLSMQTMTNNVGTLRYAAPEIFPVDGITFQRYTKSVDVYSYGSVAFQVFVKKHPLNQLLHENDILLAHRQKLAYGYLMDDLFETEIDEIIRKLILSCVTHSPKKRPTFPQICEIWSDM